MAVTTTPTRPWTSLEVCKLADLTYRQLDLWCRRGYLHPTRSGDDHDLGYGSGYARVWPWTEVVKACAMAGMVRAGITHAKAAQLVAAGQTATLVTRELRDAIIDDLPPTAGPTLVVRSRS